MTDALKSVLPSKVAPGKPACSLSSWPYCNARKRLPLKLIDRLARTVGDKLEAASLAGWKWRGRTVKLVDGTTLSMPDTADNQRAYPQSGTQKPGLGFPLAMMAGIISLSTGAVLRWALGPCRGKHTGEQALLRTRMPELGAGDVILVDRHHCNYFTAAAQIAPRALSFKGSLQLLLAFQTRLRFATRASAGGASNRQPDWLQRNRTAAAICGVCPLRVR